MYGIKEKLKAGKVSKIQKDKYGMYMFVCEN